MAAWVVWGMLLAVGCAQGYSASPPEGLADALGNTPADPGNTASGGVLGGAGTGAAADAGMSGDPMASASAADQCARGETDVCPCAATQTEGERVCVADKTSPTGGYFGLCENCKATTPASSGTGGSGAGTGGSGTGGTPGTTPKPPVTPAGGCTAMPTMCTGLLACCKPDGKCGIGLAPLCL